MVWKKIHSSESDPTDGKYGDGTVWGWWEICIHG